MKKCLVLMIAIVAMFAVSCSRSISDPTIYNNEDLGTPDGTLTTPDGDPVDYTFSSIVGSGTEDDPLIVSIVGFSSADTAENIVYAMSTISVGANISSQDKATLAKALPTTTTGIDWNSDTIVITQAMSTTQDLEGYAESNVATASHVASISSKPKKYFAIKAVAGTESLATVVSNSLTAFENKYINTSGYTKYSLTDSVEDIYGLAGEMKMNYYYKDGAIIESSSVAYHGTINTTQYYYDGDATDKVMIAKGTTFNNKVFFNDITEYNLTKQDNAPTSILVYLFYEEDKKEDGTTPPRGTKTESISGYTLYKKNSLSSHTEMLFDYDNYSKIDNNTELKYEKNSYPYSGDGYILVKEVGNNLYIMPYVYYDDEYNKMYTTSWSVDWEDTYYQIASK